MNPIPEALQREGFHALFFGHPDATYVFDTTGAFIQCNDRLIELTGYSRDELHEMTFDPIVHPDDRGDVVAEFVAAVAGESRRYQSRGVTKSGEVFVIDVTNIPARDDDGNVVAVIGIARDIGDVRRAEHARLRMEGELQSTLNQMEIGIAFVDRNWCFTFVNQKGLEFLQSDRDGSIGASLLDVFPGISDTDFGATCRLAMHDGQVATTRAFSQDLQKWVELTVFPTDDGIALHVTDVTEDQRTKLILEENAARMRAQAALLEASQEVMYLRDLDGRITYWNKGAEKLFGWESDEIIGERAIDLLSTDREIFQLATEQVLREGAWDDEVELLTKDGRVIIVDCRWQLMTNDDGVPVSIFAVDSDITEWKRDEEKRNRAQRLESLGTLAGGIAHDLNNVLTPILMSAQLLSATEKDAGRLALFNSIESGVLRGADMVRQVLSFARGEEGQRSAVDIWVLFGEVNEFVRATLPKSIQFQLDAPTPLRPVVGDPTQLFQVLVNLVTNASDAMGGDGLLTIRGRNLDRTEAPGVTIEVEDSGSGMDAETVAKIFEPFFTTKSTGSGTGLGLSTSMTIIRNHGGELDVYSEPGHGSRFRIRLPAIIDEADRPIVEAEETESLPHGNNERVLVVDDEATIREIACQTLEAGGYRTVAAEHGRAAIELIESGDVDIDLVFTDMMMPEMDGAATAAYFLKHHPHIAVLAASGLNANGGVARAAHSGVTAFLSKPFTTSELLTAVRATLDTWGNHDSRS